jgi:hypothetical protein
LFNISGRPADNETKDTNDAEDKSSTTTEKMVGQPEGELKEVLESEIVEKPAGDVNMEEETEERDGEPGDIDPSAGRSSESRHQQGKQCYFLILVFFITFFS